MGRGAVCFCETERRVSEKNGASHPQEGKAKDRWQWKPGKGRAARARMFGSDAHIVRKEKARFVPPVMEFREKLVGRRENSGTDRGRSRRDVARRNAALSKALRPL